MRMKTANWQTNVETVAQAFRAAVEQSPDAIYCKGAAGALTYAQAAGAIQSLADELRPNVAKKPVAIVLPNSQAFFVAYFAVLFAGGIPALINHGHPPATIEKLIGQLDAAVVLSDKDHTGQKTRVLNDVLLRDMVETVDLDRLTDPGGPDGIAAILYSGGTTGMPKQVPHSNAVILLKMARGDWGWQTRKGEVWLPVAPFTHIYGFLMGLTNPIIRAGTVVIPERFHPDLIVDLLATENVTIFGGVV